MTTYLVLSLPLKLDIEFQVNKQLKNCALKLIIKKKKKLYLCYLFLVLLELCTSYALYYLFFFVCLFLHGHCSYTEQVKKFWDIRIANIVIFNRNREV